MPRALDTATLDRAAEYYAGLFMMNAAPRDRDWVVGQFNNFTFKDEYAHLMAAIKGELGPKAQADFEARAGKVHAPRDDKVFADLLAGTLAITPDGKHIPGKIGTSVIGSRIVGRRVTRHGVKNACWRIYAGEEEERALGHVREIGKDGPGCCPLPPPDTLWPDETAHLGVASTLMALNTNVSYAFAAAGMNAARLLLDEGSDIGVIEGRSDSGSQPVDPDAAITGVLLFTLGLAAIALGAAADDAPGAKSTAGTIVADTDIDNTGTLSHCRASSTNDGSTPLNDHIDGEAGISGGDFNWNTLAMVAGGQAELTSWTATQPQGPTAT